MHYPTTPQEHPMNTYTLRHPRLGTQTIEAARHAFEALSLATATYGGNRADWRVVAGHPVELPGPDVLDMLDTYEPDTTVRLGDMVNLAQRLIDQGERALPAGLTAQNLASAVVLLVAELDPDNA